MIPWLILFYIRRDLRAEMIIMGGVMALGVSFSCYRWCTVDWWHPLTITNTRIGIEDFICGFAIGGIAAALYEEIFKRHHRKNRNRKVEHDHPIIFFSIIALFLLSTEFFFSYLGLTSFIASTLAEALIIILLIARHRVPLMQALASGVATAFISMPVYWTMNFLSPGWIDATYYFDTLSKIRFITIPIEELIFYFMMGMLFGPLYDYWKGYRHFQQEKRVQRK